MQTKRALAGIGLAFAAAFAAFLAGMGCGTDAAAARDAGAEARATATTTTTATATATVLRSAAPATVSAPTSCASIGADIARVEAKYAGAAFPCTTAADCACYGGPVCPNALVKQCPTAIGASAERELAQLSEAWSAADCGGYAWSPYGCEAACIDGRCGSSFN